MKAIFYILALLAISGAAYFSYDNLGKFKAEQADKNQAVADNKKMSKNADDKEEELTKEKENLDTAEKDKADAIATIENLEAKERTLRRDLGELENTLEEQKAKFVELEKSKKEIEELLGGTGLELEDLGPEITRMEEEKKAKAKKLGELEELVSAAQKSVSSNQAEIARLADRAARRNARIRRNAMESVVSAVNDDWGFVIIGAGSNTGFTPQTRLLVKRNGRLIAEVKPSAIEPTQTIAEIDQETLAPGARIQPGDRVILANPATN